MKNTKMEKQQKAAERVWGLIESRRPIVSNKLFASDESEATIDSSIWFPITFNVKQSM